MATGNLRLNRWEVYSIALFASITMTETHRPGFSTCSRKYTSVASVAHSRCACCCFFLAVCHSECVGQIVIVGLDEVHHNRHIPQVVTCGLYNGFRKLVCLSYQGHSMVTYRQISLGTATPSRTHQVEAAEAIVMVQTTSLRVPCVWSYQS